MPELTGSELARQTLDRRQEENSPMLIHTGHTDSVRTAELDEMVSLGIIDASFIKGKHDILSVLEAYHNGDPIPAPSIF
jgi:hypothetical protein